MGRRAVLGVPQRDPVKGAVARQRPRIGPGGECGGVLT
ncbi:hypothetical protein SGL43_02106 [Streptomyces globisporus]|uniref:Uncharacterized protein n=1 Tax=Streptomyces globisporus TaxID=1908 RepID=A0ABN8V1N2_STRGL|nr:hypothetical protein SGL43_02106 [Streptomyces globisporus]